MFTRVHRPQREPAAPAQPATAPGPFAIQRTSFPSAGAAGGSSPESPAPVAVPAAKVAASGTEGSGGPLPFLEAIQRSFGRHDVSGVRAHSGPRTRAATGALGAEAYAMGEKIAFDSANPSLRTVAHEAAHAVQQRFGVRLSGGLGEAGDIYERQADAVAAKVVAGESAERLLGELAGRDRTPARAMPRAERGGAVQRVNKRGREEDGDGEEKGKVARMGPLERLDEEEERAQIERLREDRERAAQQIRAAQEEAAEELELATPPPVVTTPRSEEDGHLEEDRANYPGGTGDPILELDDDPQQSYRNVLKALPEFQDLDGRTKRRAARAQAQLVEGRAFSSVLAFESGHQAVAEVQLKRNPGISDPKSYTTSHGEVLTPITFERLNPSANIDFGNPLADTAKTPYAPQPIPNTFHPAHVNVDIRDPVKPKFLFQTNFQNGKPVPVVSAATGRDHHFAAGNRAVKRPDWGRASPDDWTWHHLLPKGRMSLVDRRMHAKHGHNGGMLFWQP